MMARLVDTYSSGKPIRRALLVDHAAFKMKLRRDPSCDVLQSEFFLGPLSEIFDPGVPEKLRSQPSESVHCYTVDHDATRLAK